MNTWPSPRFQRELGTCRTPQRGTISLASGNTRRTHHGTLHLLNAMPYGIYYFFQPFYISVI